MPDEQLTEARYDGIAEWYDTYNSPAAALNGPELADLLGDGTGLCLDLGCGTGQYFDAIRGTGRVPVGLDYSADQLRLAAARHGVVLRADAAALPFPDATFPTVTIMWISTDVDDFASVVREATRVLRPGGRLVFFGAHPCFNGPAVQTQPDGGVTVHPTYRAARWHRDASWWKPGGIRGRAGMRHLPLADLINAFLNADLAVERLVEPGDPPVPVALAIRARRRTRS